MTVTADAQSKEYGDDDPAVTYQFSEPLPFGDTFTGSLSRVPGENVGTYTIKQGSLALSTNYKLAFNSADLTIGRRPITVKADAKTKTWGEDDPALTYHVTSGSLGFNDAFSGALTRETGDEPGSYNILRGTLLLTDNYDLTFVGASFTIAKATPTLSVINSPVTYNGSPRTAVLEASVEGMISNILYNGDPTPPTDAGIYIITADFIPADTVHYNSLTTQSAGNFVITPYYRIYLPLVRR